MPVFWKFSAYLEHNYLCYISFSQIYMYVVKRKEM